MFEFQKGWMVLDLNREIGLMIEEIRRLPYLGKKEIVEIVDTHGRKMILRIEVEEICTIDQRLFEKTLLMNGYEDKEPAFLESKEIEFDKPYCEHRNNSLRDKLLRQRK